MDKQTLSNYGLLTVVTLILAVMLAFATPFGTYVGDGVVSVANGFVSASNKSIDEDNISNLEKQWGDKLNNNNGGNEPPAPIVRNGIIPDDAVYTPNGGVAITGNGTNTFPATPATGDTYEEGDYIYTYNRSGYGLNWSVIAKDKSKTTYGAIISEIAGKPITSMGFAFQSCTKLTTAPTIPSSVTYINSTFKGCKSLTTTPTIPNSITSMSNAFENCTSLTTAPAIPNSVMSMSNTFRGCISLATAPTIPSSVTNMDNTFNGCTSLTGTIEVNANPNTYSYCLNSTQITGITGSCTQETKDALMATK